MIKTFLELLWPCGAATMRLLQMCELCDNGQLQLPSTCPWCSAPVTVNGFSLYMQLWTYAGHVKDAGSCVGSYTAVLDQWNTVQGQVVPVTKSLLSDTDKQKADKYCTDYAALCMSVNGHRQWPSMGQPLTHFISTLVGNARAAFVKDMMPFAKGKDKLESITWVWMSSPSGTGVPRSNGMPRASRIPGWVLRRSALTHCYTSFQGSNDRRNG